MMRQTGCVVRHVYEMYVIRIKGGWNMNCRLWYGNDDCETGLCIGNTDKNQDCKLVRGCNMVGRSSNAICCQMFEMFVIRKLRRVEPNSEKWPKL